MKMFELLPRPLGSIFRKLTPLTCNSPGAKKDAAELPRLCLSVLREAYAAEIASHGHCAAHAPQSTHFSASTV